MELVVTPNEVRLIDALSTSPKQMPWVKEELKVGDCAIRRNEGNHEVVCVVERKTVNDLWASFRDHRYEDQKRRLHELKEQGLGEVVYVIEGSLFNQPDTRVRSIRACLHSLQSSSRFIVHRTSDIAETIEVLGAIMRYHEKSAVLGPSVSCPLTVSQLKQKPGDALASSMWPLHALCIIPQMSVLKAKALLGKYGSLSALIEELTVKEEGVTRVASVQVEGSRKIGKVLACRMRESFLSAIGEEKNG